MRQQSRRTRPAEGTWLRRPCAQRPGGPARPPSLLAPLCFLPSSGRSAVGGLSGRQSRGPAWRRGAEGVTVLRRLLEAGRNQHWFPSGVNCRPSARGGPVGRAILWYSSRVYGWLLGLRGDGDKPGAGTSSVPGRFLGTEPWGRGLQQDRLPSFRGKSGAPAAGTARGLGRSCQR